MRYQIKPDMANMRLNKNGFVLIIIIVFMLIVMITTYALSMLASSNYSVMGINAPAQIQGYYATIGALRYAAIVMLYDQKNVLDILSITNPSTWSLKTYSLSTYQELGLQPPHDINITIQDMGNRTYTLTASYS